MHGGILQGEPTPSTSWLEIDSLMKNFRTSKSDNTQVAMKIVVDNVAVLGLEFSLLEKLSSLLSSDVVMNLDDSIVQEIAAEKEDSRIERARALSKLQSLEAGLYTLRRLGRHKLEGGPTSS